MFVVGVYDDLYNANFKLKFLLQIISAKVLIDQGFIITNFHGLLGLYDVPWLFGQLTTVFVFLAVVNAINFIDGIDGLAITEVIKTLLLIMFLGAVESEIYTLNLIIIFSLLPLYYFNFKKQGKVFLGDGGSLLLGTLIMINLLFVLGENYVLKTSFSINKTLFAVLLILYPLTDLLRIYFVRLKNKKSPFEADQNHLHHLILNKVKIPFLAVLVLSIGFTIISGLIVTLIIY